MWPLVARVNWPRSGAVQSTTCPSQGLQCPSQGVSVLGAAQGGSDSGYRDWWSRMQGHTGKYEKDEAGKVGLGQRKDLETTALTLDLSTGSSFSSPAHPIHLLTASQPWLP